MPADWTYAPAPESTDIVRLQERYGLYVGGEWLDTKEHFTTISPRDESPLAEVAQASEADVAERGRRRARGVRRPGRSCPGSERAKYLFRIARILAERSREFAVLESLNGGKPIKESRDVDLPLAAAHFFYYAGWADKLEYAFPNRSPKPLGVAGQIIPWNFPLLMLAWKIAPALAAGNTVVLKPAETTPLTALLFCDVVRQAELPPGVVNIVTGDGSTGAALVESEVDKIAFTGSTDVGKAIQRRLAGTGKKLTLELGGKAANIVFDDCALDQAVEGIVNGIYFNQGHVCCAGSRLFVQESIYEPVVEKLKKRMTTLRVGDPLDKNTDVGAINSRMQLDKIEELVAAGKEEGAEIYQPPCRLPEKGYWFAPTVFTNVAQSYRIAQEEIFGPVLSVLTFRTPDEAVEKANNTPYGLSAGVWTEKGSRILWMAERLRAGVVWANTFNRFDPTSPFGGYKESGFGREGGLHGMEPYLDFAMTRLPVKKTYKLFIGGAFPRSESGRTYEAQGQNVARASRKDVRDCGRRGARRAAEVGGRDRLQPRPGALPDRGDDGGARLRSSPSCAAARTRCTARSTAGSGTPASPTSSRRCSARRTPSPGRTSTSRSRSRPASSPSSRPTSRRCSASSRASRRRSPAATRSIALASETQPLAAIELAEAIATADVPGGVVNLLTGQRAELAPWLASHMDVNAIDLTGADGLRTDLEIAAAENVKRVIVGKPDSQSLYEISAFLELKTVWHPIGV